MQFGRIGIGTKDVQTRFQESAPALGDTVGRLNAAVGPCLSHRFNLDTGDGVGARYLETSVLTFAVRWVNDDQ